MTTDAISPDLKTVLRRLKLSALLDTLARAPRARPPAEDAAPRLPAARLSRRGLPPRQRSPSTSARRARAPRSRACSLERWDATAKVTFDHALLNELVSLRFRRQPPHVAIVGPVGVGKTFLAHALGHIACRRGHCARASAPTSCSRRSSTPASITRYEAELRKLLAVDLLILDDFALDAMDATESRDCYEILTERHRAGSIIVTSNRGPDEWLATFADPVRAQSAIDRFTSNAYDLVIEGESYRPRLKPKLPAEARR